MFKPKNTKERVRHRLQISLGHLKKVITMVDNQEYCIDILHQSQAIQKALKETDALILENHLKSCAINAIKKGNKDKAIEEIITIFKKNNQ